MGLWRRFSNWWHNRPKLPFWRDEYDYDPKELGTKIVDLVDYPVAVVQRRLGHQEFFHGITELFSKNNVKHNDPRYRVEICLVKDGWDEDSCQTGKYSKRRSYEIDQELIQAFCPHCGKLIIDRHDVDGMSPVDILAKKQKAAEHA